MKGLLLIKSGSLSTEARFANGAKTIKLWQIHCSWLLAILNFSFRESTSIFPQGLKGVHSSSTSPDTDSGCRAWLTSRQSLILLLCVLHLQAPLPISGLTLCHNTWWHYPINWHAGSFNPTTNHATNSFTRNIWVLRCSFGGESLSIMAWWCYVHGSHI